MTKPLDACTTLDNELYKHCLMFKEGVFVGWDSDMARMLIAAALHRAAAIARREVLQELLDKAHGGGNWRRVATQLMAAQDERKG